jgi:Arc/MetJ-type ribon-helix-helix transcriptional regulator
MGRTKIAITLDTVVLDRIDRLVKEQAFPNRSRAIQEAVQEKLARLGRTRLYQECAKLDPTFEKALAEEGLSSAVERIGARIGTASPEELGQTIEGLNEIIC